MTTSATSPEKGKAIEHLTVRAETLTAQQIRARVRAVELEAAPPPGATARTILVFNRADGTPEYFDMELTWKGYAMTQRLHLLDHRGQIKKLRERQGRPA